MLEMAHDLATHATIAFFFFITRTNSEAFINHYFMVILSDKPDD